MDIVNCCCSGCSCIIYDIIIDAKPATHAKAATHPPRQTSTDHMVLVLANNVLFMINSCGWLFPPKRESIENRLRIDSLTYSTLRKYVPTYVPTKLKDSSLASFYIPYDISK